MNVLTAAANEISDLHSGTDTFVGHSAMDIEAHEKPNDAADFSSARSSYSDFADFVLPPDVPDGPSFYDLASHIDQVTQQVVGQPDDVLSGALFGELSVHSSQTVPFVSGSDELNTVALQDSLPPPGSLSVASPGHPHAESQDLCQLPLKLAPAATAAETSSCVDDYDFDYSVVGNPNVFPNSTQEAQSDDALAISNPDGALSMNRFTSINAGGTGSEDSSVDDDFGDFESSAPVETMSIDTDGNGPANSSSINTANEVLDRLLSHLGPVLSRTFETVMDKTAPTDQFPSTNEEFLRHSTGHPFSLDRSFEPCLLSKLVSTTRPRNRRYRWDNSVIYEAYLESVHVDKTYSAPVPAPRLELLQPVRLKAPHHPVSSDNLNVEPTPCKAVCVPQADPLPTSNGTTTTTNAPVLSSPLDLDFLENRCDSMTSPNNSKLVTLSALELELLTQVPEATTAPVGSTASPFAPSSSDVQPKLTTSLRENVRAALARLPKLTYMRSRHLNFPISDIRPNP